MNRTHFPIVTTLLITVMALLAVAVATDGATDYDTLSRHFLIEPTPAGIWSGHYYYFSLLAAAFVHLNPISLVFCGIWIYIIGRRIELAYGPWVVLGLALGGAIVSDAWELGINHWQPPFGAVAIVYALFGFLLAADRMQPRGILKLPAGARRTLLILLPVWCVLALVFHELWFSGFSTPIVGMLLGLAVGAAFLGKRIWRWAGAAGLLLLCSGAAVAVTAPTFNPQWRFWRGTVLAAQGNINTAHDMLLPLVGSRDPVVQNALAWLLATIPDPRLRNGQLAVQLALRACRGAGYKNAGTSDTLAAACAEAGLWPRAEQVQLSALKGLDNDSHAISPAGRALFADHLKAIQLREPIRDYSLLGRTAPVGNAPPTFIRAAH